MAIVIACSSCGGALRLPDHMIGSDMTIACPHCRKVLGNVRELASGKDVEAPPPASEPSVPQSAPRRSPPNSAPPVPRVAKPFAPPPPVRKLRRPAPPPEEEPLIAEVVLDKEAPTRPVEEFKTEDAPDDTGYEIVAGDPKPAPAPRFPDAAEDEPQVRRSRLPRSRRKRLPGTLAAWDKVRIGFKLISIGTMIAIVIAALNLVIALIARSVVSVSSGPPSPAVIGGGVGFGYVFFTLEEIALFAAFVLYIVGLVFCTFAPPDHGAKIFAIVTLALTLLGCGLPVLGYFASLASLSVARFGEPSFDFMAAGLVPMMLFGGVGLLASVVLFLLLERAIGVCLRADDLVRMVYLVLILMGGAIVAIIIIQGVLAGMTAHTVAQGFAGQPDVQGLFSGWQVALCLYGIIYLIVTIAYAAAIFRTHSVLVDHVNR